MITLQEKVLTELGAAFTSEQTVRLRQLLEKDRETLKKQNDVIFTTGLNVTFGQ